MWSQPIIINCKAFEWSDLTLGSSLKEEIMGCESSYVIKFDLGPLLQGQMRVDKLKSACNLLIIEKCCLSLKLYCWPFLVDTSFIWQQMHRWSSLKPHFLLLSGTIKIFTTERLRTFLLNNLYNGVSK